MNIKHQGKGQRQSPEISNHDGLTEKTRPSVFTGQLGWIVLVTLFGLSLVKARANDAIAYPYYFQPDANPIFRHVRSADPDAHVWPDGQMWVYASQDHVGGYANLDGYHVFSSPDLIHWTDHGEALHSRDVSWGTNGFMWAPGAAYKNNTYYLYYPHKDKSDSFRIGVATSKTPEGPFKDIGHYIEGTFGTDPMCFIDDDGTAYLYFDRVVAKLNPNMVELAEKPRNIEYGAANLSKEMCDFGEGVWVFKKDGIYYFTYTNFKNPKQQGFYSMGKSPYGPFVYKGPMAPAPIGAQDHHSMVKFHENWYYFYHTSYYNNPEWPQGEVHNRAISLDRLYFNPDGTIPMVKETKESIEPIRANQKAETNAMSAVK